MQVTIEAGGKRPYPYLNISPLGNCLGEKEVQDNHKVRDPSCEPSTSGVGGGGGRGRSEDPGIIVGREGYGRRWNSVGTGIPMVVVKRKKSRKFWQFTALYFAIKAE